MQEEHKIKVKLPYLIYDILKNDSAVFSVNLNALCNRIFSGLYARAEIRDDGFGVDKDIQFKLTNDNAALFETLRMTDPERIEYKSRFFRALFWAYCDNPSFKRELLIFSDRMSLIREAVTKKRRLLIEYKNSENRLIEPYAVLTDKEQATNYIFSWCLKNGEYRNYRLSNARPLMISADKQSFRDEEHVRTVKRNFDPFLSFGNRVKVKFSDYGVELFEKLIIKNRPEIISKDGRVYELECSMRRAKVYFSTFLDEAVVLEPRELAVFFHDKALSMAEKYSEEKK